MTFSNRISERLVALSGAVLLCGATALAQSAGSMQQPPGGNPGMQQTTQPETNMGTNTGPNGQTMTTDKAFVEEALKGGMAEVQLGQLALQKSSNDDVKQFAQKMVDDHTKLGEQMKPIAQQIGVKIPDSPSKKDKATMAKLQALDGSAFDEAYMKDMVKDHKSDLNNFKTEAQNGSDPNVRNAANQGSQIISQHLQMAEQITQKNNIASK